MVSGNDGWLIFKISTYSPLGLAGWLIPHGDYSCDGIGSQGTTRNAPCLISSRCLKVHPDVLNRSNNLNDSKPIKSYSLSLPR